VILPSCLLLPIPTAAVVRRRVADLLVALDAVLVELPEPPPPSATEAVAEARVALDDAARPLVLFQRVTHRVPRELELATAARAQQERVDALLAAEPPSRATVGEARRGLGALRRSLRPDAQAAAAAQPI
jgi:hypothetical protein